MLGIAVTMQPDGSLLLQANNDTRADLSHTIRTHPEGWRCAETDILEMVRGQYVARHAPHKGFGFTLEWLDPADIFAMSDMPMLADNCRDDDDAVRVYGPVWGFPDYAIRDYVRELAHKGRVVFQRIEDFGDGMTFPSRRIGPDVAAAERLAMRAYENCLDPVYVTKQIPDLHGEAGATIARLVDIAKRSDIREASL